MKKILLPLLLLAGLGALLWWSFRPRPLPVEIGTVVRDTLVVTLDNDGRTRIREQYTLRSPLVGTLHRVQLEPGDRIERGSTVLMRLDPPPASLLDDRSIAQARARVEAARAARTEAERQQQRAEEQTRLARTAFVRQQELRRDELASQAALDQAERELRLWEGQAAAAAATVTRTAFEIEVAAAALQHIELSPVEPKNPNATPRDSDLTTLEWRAPIDGVVLRVLRESEGPIAAGEPVLEFGDPADLEIVADYLSTAAVRVQPGMKATIERWGGDQPLDARVRIVEPAGFTKISALGVEEQRVDILLDLVVPAERGPAGVLARRPGAVHAPGGAVGPGVLRVVLSVRRDGRRGGQGDGVLAVGLVHVRVHDRAGVRRGVRHLRDRGPLGMTQHVVALAIVAVASTWLVRRWLVAWRRWRKREATAGGCATCGPRCRSGADPLPNWRARPASSSRPSQLWPIRVQSRLD